MNKVEVAPNPQLAFLDVTSICNLKCAFCYNSAENVVKHPKLENLLRIQNILSVHGCKEIIYLGGEPSIYPYINDLLMNGCKLNIHQTMITNGQKITLEMVQLFEKIPDFKLGISFHDYREDTYEKVSCVKGSYANIIKTMNLIDDHNINWYTQTSVLRNNYAHLFDLYKFLKKYKNLRYMDFSRMISDGRGKDADNFLTMNEWKDVFISLKTIFENGMDCIIESFPLCWLKRVCAEKNMSFDIIKKLVRPCGMFISQIALDFNGNIRICPTGGETVANIFTTDLKEIWNKNKTICDYRNFQWLSPYCFDEKHCCEFFVECVGGCRRSCSSNKYSCDDYWIGVE